MRLFEMKTLPSAFGKAKIEYVEGDGNPYRERNTIVIPNDGRSELFSLSKNQFLLHRVGRQWFGGTDENPFLVELTGEPFDAFVRGGVLGSACFYTVLRYREVDRLSGIVRRLWKRQGDIFAVPLNMGWTTLEKCFQVASRDLEVMNCESHSVFGTRHILNGMVVDKNATLYGIGVGALGSGVISAPDHTDMNLGDRPHALYQTAGLRSPREAD